MMNNGSNYPFLISMRIDLINLGDTGGTFWIYIQKRNFTFWFFGVFALRKFIIQDDEKIVKKILSGLEKWKKPDSRLAIV